MAYAGTHRSSGLASARALRFGRLVGLLYGVAGVTVMAAFWPLFGVFLSNAPRLGAPWLERSADVGLGVANPLLAGAIDLALIAAFGLQHSLMARPALKQRWRGLIPPALERATYVHAANIALLMLIACWQPIPIVVWHVELAPLRDACWGLFALGWIILLAGALSFGITELLGLRQVLDWYWERTPQPLPLKTSGLYRWLKHPMYVGVLLAVWATPHMTIGHALLAAGMTVYVLIAKGYEERDLNRTYGRVYQAWRSAR